MATGSDPGPSGAGLLNSSASSESSESGTPSSGSSSTVEPLGCECGPSSGTTPTKKRKRNVENWQKTKRKRLRNSGKDYLSATKKKVHLDVILAYIRPHALNTHVRTCMHTLTRGGSRNLGGGGAHPINAI